MKTYKATCSECAETYDRNIDARKGGIGTCPTCREARKNAQFEFKQECRTCTIEEPK